MCCTIGTAIITANTNACEYCCGTSDSQHSVVLRSQRSSTRPQQDLLSSPLRIAHTLAFAFHFHFHSHSESKSESNSRMQIRSQTERTIARPARPTPRRRGLCSCEQFIRLDSTRRSLLLVQYSIIDSHYYFFHSNAAEYAVLVSSYSYEL